MVDMFQAATAALILISSLVSCHGFTGESTTSSFVPSRRVSKRHDGFVSRDPVDRTRFPRGQRHYAYASYNTPQANPHTENDRKSLSGVSHESVLSALNVLYPPQGLQMRNAASRTDGYWAFISQGEEPPMDLTYGEFDFHFFAQLLDRAHSHYYQSHPNAPPTWENKIMMDIGSGTGRLVLGAAALDPDWKECRGIELLKGIHDVAVDKLAECAENASGRVLGHDDDADKNIELSMAPVKLVCGSFDDPSHPLGDVDCAFAFSSCFSPDLMTLLGQAVGRQCKPGTIIITTDYMIPLENSIPQGNGRGGSYKLELAEKLDGWCWLTGGESTAYIHRVVESLAA